MTQTTGRYALRDGAPVVRFERTFPHPVDAVWEAITDSEQLEQWFPTTVEFESLAAGAAIEFRFAEARYPAMTGQVLEVRPRERFAFTWGDDRLAEVAGGTAPQRPAGTGDWEAYYEEYKRQGLPATAEIPH